MFTKVVIVDINDPEKKETPYVSLPAYLPREKDFMHINSDNFRQQGLYQVVKITHATNLVGWSIVTIFVEEHYSTKEN